MRKLPLATLGAATALGLLATAAQAAPVSLTPSQMDELTAGASSVTVSINVTSDSEVNSAAESTGDGSASSSASQSSSFELNLSANAEDTPPP
jgi:hypothetical protein